ncbi:hypothetical protein [Bradyrhizobium sp. WD16]|uniref:hypothetical protein n=1 Tax=Bradyrhizobium sp. WD16 TaxID=1521768 RepID=UPI0020A26450|nr:hypothetical protein [Bradyrhizobium sp. WD16]
MYKTAIAAAAVLTALMTTAASAAPLPAAPTDTAGYSDIDQVRLVCNEDGQCWRSRRPRYVRRYEEGVVARHSYAA